MERLILSPSALEYLRRLYSYGWLPERIVHVFNQLHGLDLTPTEIKRFCRDSNAFLDAELDNAAENEPDSATNQRSEPDAL